MKSERGCHWSVLARGFVCAALLAALCGGTAAFAAAGADDARGGAPYAGLTVRDIQKDATDNGLGIGGAPTLPGVGAVLWMLFWVCVIVALIYGAVFFIRRYVPAARNIFGGGVLKIVGKTYVSSKQSILLVKVGSRFVMVGVTGASMSPLAEITDAEEAKQIAAELAAGGGQAAGGSFRKALGRADEGYPAGENAAASKGPSENELGKLRDELDAVTKKVNWWRNQGKG